METLHFSKTKLQDGFWSHYADLVRNVTVPAVYVALFDPESFYIPENALTICVCGKSCKCRHQIGDL